MHDSVWASDFDIGTEYSVFFTYQFFTITGYEKSSIELQFLPIADLVNLSSANKYIPLGRKVFFSLERG